MGSTRTSVPFVFDKFYVRNVTEVTYGNRWINKTQRERERDKDREIQRERGSRLMTSAVFELLAEGARSRSPEGDFTRLHARHYRCCWRAGKFHARKPVDISLRLYLDVAVNEYREEHAGTRIA